MKFAVAFIIVAFLLIGNAFSSVQQKEILHAIENGIDKLISGGTPPAFLFNAVKNISQIQDESEHDETICKSCQLVLNNVIAYRRSGAHKKSMMSYLKALCNVFSDYGSVACSGYVEIEIVRKTERDTVLFIIDNKRNLTPERVCSIHFQANKCQDPDADKWVIPLPPALNASKAIARETDQTTSIKVLHLTDIHYDPQYQPDSNAECDEPLCCQNGTASDPKNAAGYWGDYHVCDMPQHSVENLLAHIKEHHVKDIEYVYYTGDIISHKSWTTSKEENTKTIKYIYGRFADVFQNKTVYPILGNHEPHPTDFYSSDGVSQDHVTTQWIFNLSATEWSRWLPDDTSATILKGGYYTVLVRPGFRIVALNSNVCFTSNLWLAYEDRDPHQQLTWLVEVLHKAEQLNERVHILSHIPPGEILCHKQWSNQFRKIINRFANTISAQFNGHTHIDEFRVFYSPDKPDRVINVAFNGASFTTFVGFNPNFRIYQVNSSDAMVANFDQFIYNLTRANEKKTAPEWYKLYSFKEAYGLPDLKLDRFGDLLQKMSNSLDLMWQYYRFLVRDSDVKIKEGCDTKCLKQLLCYITAVETNESVNC
ncbi:hypothetical protein NQ317_007176 [Molorchus minor]|uniref:Sphingomyelin phosphodiesterase n=1 Tax=Molorchus minor TaxID=1323400 RepID=A0ABQ9IVT9_9CUCU|nr:hypothetical protein NQ317_007176 [Molorchus minor]